MKQLNRSNVYCTAWFMNKKELISVTLKRTLKLKQYLKTIISVLCSHSVWKFIHRNRGRIFKELLRNKLRLSWGSVHGLYFSNIEMVGLTWHLLSVPVYMWFFWPMTYSLLCCYTHRRDWYSIEGSDLRSASGDVTYYLLSKKYCRGKNTKAHDEQIFTTRLDLQYNWNFHNLG